MKSVLSRETIRRNRPDSNRIDYMERVDEYELPSLLSMMDLIEVDVPLPNWT